jgi:hypothetical protein
MVSRFVSCAGYVIYHFFRNVRKNSASVGTSLKGTTVDKLPIPESIKWLFYLDDVLMLVTDMLPKQLRAFDHYLKKWDTLDKDTQRFLAAVVEVEWLREAEKYKDLWKKESHIDYLHLDRDATINAKAWRKAVE